MRISFFGHSSFFIEQEGGIRIITDPYEPGCYNGTLQYAPIDESADIVTISHGHADHNFASGFPGAKILDKEGSYNILNIDIEGILSYHDRAEGKFRGRNVIFVIKSEGLKVAHFGDLGTTNINYEKLKDIDVAMMPVGGHSTVSTAEVNSLYEKLNPRIFLPMHYKTGKLDFDIATEEEFLSGKTDIEVLNDIEITCATIKSFHKKIIMLNYQR